MASWIRVGEKDAFMHELAIKELKENEEAIKQLETLKTIGWAAPNIEGINYLIKEHERRIAECKAEIAKW